MQPGRGLNDVPNIPAARALAAELEQQFRRLQEEGPELQKKARELQVTEKSRDGLITATVGARGQLIRLDIDPRIYRRPDARALADQITETIKKAGVRMQEEIIEMFAPLVPREHMEAQLSGNISGLREFMYKQMRGEG